MEAWQLIALIIFLMVASVMATIGVSQSTATNPVGFYTFGKPPRKDELDDVRAWNRGHGRLFIAYGAVIALLSLPLVFTRSAAGPICACAGALLPIPLLIAGHNKLVKKHVKKEPGSDDRA